MTKSGFYIGDNIVVRAVDTKTLKVGDKIAFYVYAASYRTFNVKNCEKIEETAENLPEGERLRLRFEIKQIS